MNNIYNSRQRKIYEDYAGCSTDTLVEMVKSENYLDEVTNVLKDILASRNVIIKESKQEIAVPLVSESENKEIEKDRIEKLKAIQQEVEFYSKQLENSSDKDLAEIITRYTSYQLPAVEAALIMAEKRGTISSQERKKLSGKIRKGFNEYNTKEESITKENLRKSSRQIQTGFILVLIGLGLTVWTINNPVRGYYIVFYGLILSGVILLYKGFFIEN